ncbi:MAG: hypothetical protein HY561_01955 [Gemmatimonadetes bacterium]|nr:hypothetical protein [Gemmatimonadota bacterium]
MGGAFVGLADDATAAATNPAGLTTLLYPEVSFEYKTVEYTWPFAADGKESSDRVGTPSFASVVIPAGNLRFAAFRHEIVHVKQTATWTASDALYTYAGELSDRVKVENYGAAVAIAAVPQLSLGLAAGGSRYSENGTWRFTADGTPQTGKISGEAPLRPFASAGLLIRPSEKVQLGVAYHFRGTFRGDYDDGFLDGDPAAEDFEIRVPDSFGAGFAVRPLERLVLSVSGVLQRYSELDADDADDWNFDDALDVSAGGEYVLLLGNIPLALRAGAQRLASSSEYYDGSDTQFQYITKQDPELAIDLGAGIVLGGRFQLDLAGMASSVKSEGVLSIVYRLGRR